MIVSSKKKATRPVDLWPTMPFNAAVVIIVEEHSIHRNGKVMHASSNRQKSAQASAVFAAELASSVQ